METPRLAACFISVLGNRWYEASPNPAVCSCFTNGFIFPAVPSILPLPTDLLYSSSNAPPNSVQDECLTVMLL